MKIKPVRQILIENGVRNLREFGYPDCDAQNILTDRIYKVFFESMLRDNIGKGFDAEVNSLLEELKGLTL